MLKRFFRPAGAALAALIALLALVGLAAPSSAQPADGGAGEQSIMGLIRDADRAPIEGVTMTVTDNAGAPVGEAETDADGRWEVSVPSAGVYNVEVDEASLPDGVELEDPSRNPQEVRVLSGQQRAAAFSLTGSGGGAPPAGEEGEDATPAERTFTDKLFRALGNGVKVGLILAMAAVGLSLIFGTTGLINFAHGELVALGAMVAWYFNARGPTVHLVWAGLLAVILSALFGGALEKGLFRPLRTRRVGLFQVFVITIGLSLAIRHILLLLFGGSPRPYLDFTGQSALDLGPFSLTPRDLTIMALAAAILIVIAVMLETTRTGKAIRAVRDNPALASASGIDVDRVTLIVWSAGAGLAAIGGIFWGSAFQVDWLMGFRLLLLMFAAVILGGIGTAYGAMVGGLAIGVISEVSTLWSTPELKYMWGLVVLILVLLVRPQGILGRAERIG